jgi:hypothetical protein
MARRPARQAVDLARWISWDDAWKQGQRVVGSLDLVAAQLREDLVRGKIPAIDQVITEDGKIETFDLPPKFWSSTVRIGVEHAVGALVGWWPKRGSTLPGGIALKWKHTIFLGREAINALWPTAQVASAAAQGRKPRPGGRPSGPPPTHNWPTTLAAYIIRRVKAGDNITENDSKLASEFCEHCSESFDWQPEHSAVRDKIPDLLRLIR